MHDWTGNDKATHAGLEVGQGCSAYVSNWMALKGNATRILGTGVVLSSEGKVLQSLGLGGALPEPGGVTDQQHNDYCSAGRSSCPPILSCQGIHGCRLKPGGSLHSYGSFDDAADTAAFGCDLTYDNSGSPIVERATVDSKCHAPLGNIGAALSSIEGWGTEWSGKYPPWAYNMNTACPCQDATELANILKTDDLDAAASASTSSKHFGAAELLRDPAFGVPIVIGGTYEEVWAAVGYAHAMDRLFQIFLRLITANGRLAEFYGAGTNSANVQSDFAARRRMYSADEIAAQFAELNPQTRLMHEAFVEGMLQRVDEVNADLSLLPFEFTTIELESVPIDIFSLISVLQYTLFTMRRLSSGFDPTFQLSNVDLLAALEMRTGLNEAQAVFDDVATQLGSFTLTDTVVAGSGSSSSDSSNSSQHLSGQRRYAAAGQSQSTLPHVSAAQLRACRRVAEAHELVENQLRELSAASFDGSWAIVDASASTAEHPSAFASFGPQDPNTFPATFYEVFIDSDEANIQAHYWNEPGSPINQIYGIWGNVTAGRNRGHGYGNDYLLETIEDLALVRTEDVLVRDGATEQVEVYHSSGGGFAIDVDDSHAAVTLRMPFFNHELRGLNMLARLFDGLPFAEFMEQQFVQDVQSDIIHSHLQIASAGQVSAVFNGLTSALPPSFDRRFPLLRQAGLELPAYLPPLADSLSVILLSPTNVITCQFGLNS